MASKKEHYSKCWAALKQLNGDNQIYFMDKYELVFGRSTECTIFIEDKSVSRSHCIIKLIDKNFTISDMSNHGTLLNGVRLLKDHPTKLENADEISICNNKYKFCINKKRLNDTETDSLQDTQAKELTNFNTSHQEQLEVITDEINKTEMEKTGLKQEMDRKMEIEIKTKLELETMEKEEFQIDELTKKGHELLKVKEEMEKQHQKERAEMEERWRADIEELKRKLEESETSKASLEGKHLEVEQMLFTTRQYLRDVELEQNRLFDEKMEVESKLEASAKHVADLTKDTENYEKEIQEATKEKEKERKKAEEESQKVQSILDGVSDNLMCTICMDIYIDPYILGCYHAFCKWCIGRWLHTKKTVCPMCRVKISSCKGAFFYNKIINNTVNLMPEDARKEREELIKHRERQERKRARKRRHSQVVDVDGPSTSSGAQSSAQYGAHSSAQYGAHSSAQYGAHSSAQYGAHSSAQYGAHSSAQYGAHSSAQYGAHSSAQYGAHSSAQYDAQPIRIGPLQTLEILIPSIHDDEVEAEWGEGQRRGMLEIHLQGDSPYVTLAAFDLGNLSPIPGSSTSDDDISIIDLTSS